MPRSPSEFIDPIALMRIDHLQLRAKSVVDGFLSGLHRSPLHGFSVEFNEYRPYTAGDDLRTLDWKLFARTDRYYIKKFEDETNRRCYLIVDQSRSMDFGSGGILKRDYARTLAATLGYFLTLQRDAVGMMTFSDKILGYLPARHRPGHLNRLLGMLEAKDDSDSKTDVAMPLEQLVARARHRGLIILISDFLAPLDNLRRSLAMVRARRHEALVLRVLDPVELDLGWSDPMLLRDLETGKEIYVDPAAARTTYRKRFEEHALQLSNMLGELGIRLTTLSTRESMEKALFDLLSLEERRPTAAGRQGVARAPGGGAGGAR
jgi:uncharacterized protein (DUF58 family)